MSEQQRQRMLLGMLVVLIVIAVVRLWPSSDAPATQSPWDAVLEPTEDEETPRRARRSRDAVSTDPRDMPVEELDLAALEPAVGSHKIGRNPWDYYVPPPPPRPQPVTRDPVIRTPPPPAPPPPPRGPVLPQINVRFLGFFGPRDNPVAVFTDGQEIINARRGDVLREEFRVDTIGLESVTLAYVRFPDQPPRRLPIGG